MNKKFLFLTLALCLLFALCSVVGCNPKKNSDPEPSGDEITAPSITKSQYDYDKVNGGDLSVTVYLNYGSLVSFKVKDGNDVDNTLYRYTALSDTLLLYEDLLMSLEVGNNVFTVSNEKGSVDFTIVVKESPSAEFDEVTTKNYVYASMKDVSFTADFKGYEVMSVKADESLLGTDNYTITNNGITIKASYLNSKCGQCNFNIELENGQNFSFYIVTNNVFAADFDANIPLNWTLNNTLSIEDNGINGKSARISGSTGSMLLLGSPFCETAKFEKNKTYTVSFDLKNMKEGATTGVFNFLANETRKHVLAFNYVAGTASGEGNPILSYNSETGVYHIQFSFVAGNGGFTEGYIDHNNAGYDILIDNINIYEQFPLSEIENNFEFDLLKPADLVLDVVYNSEFISLFKGDSLLIKDSDYILGTDKLTLKAALFEGCNNNDTVKFALSTLNGTVYFTVKTIELNFVATFDTVKEKDYYQGADVAFALTLNENTSISSIKVGDTIVATSNYEYDSVGQKVVLKSAYLNFAPTQEYKLTLSNGQSFIFAINTQTLVAFDYDNFLPASDKNDYNSCQNPTTSAGKSGNGFSVSKSDGAWGSIFLFGDVFYQVSLTNGEFYQIEFDICANSNDVANTLNFDLSVDSVKTVFFTINLNNGEYSFANGGLGSVVKGENGWYSITIVFNKIGTGFTELEPTGPYSFTVDNLRLSAVENSKEKLSVHAAISSAKVNGTALTSSEYSVSEGNFTLNKEVIDSFTESKNLVEISFEDGSVRKYVFVKEIATVIWSDNFDDEGFVAPGVFCNDATFSVEAGWSGNAMRMKGSSGNLFLLGIGWNSGDPVSYVAGKTYRLSFELKNMGDACTLNFKGDGDNTYDMSLNVKERTGSGCTISYNAETGVMSVFTEFVAQGTGFSQMFPNQFGDGFDIMIDNITITQIA